MPANTKIKERGMMENRKMDLVVTRHKGLVQYLIEKGIVTEDVKVISHATEEDVLWKDVCGVLPHRLSCIAKTVTEIPLDLPEELRGMELTVEMVREYACEPVTYIVFVM